MRFLIVRTSVHTNLYPRVQTLRDRGHEVRLLTLVEPDHQRRDGAYGAKLLPEWGVTGWVGRLFGGRWNHPRRQFPAPGVLGSVLDQWEPDVVVIREYTPLSLTTFLLARVRGIPVLNLHQSWLGGAFRRDMREVLRGWLKSTAGGDYAEATPVLRSAGTGSPEATLVPFAYDPDYRLPPERLDWSVGEPVRLVSVLRIRQPRKRALMLLRSLQPLLQENQVELTVVGSVRDPEHPRVRRFREYRQANDLESAVTLYESLDYGDLQHLYRGQDLYVLPSRDEPAAISVLEALTQGTAVVCSDTCGTAGYPVQGRSGEVFQTDNETSLRETVADLLRRPERLRRYKRSAHRRAEEFSPDCFYESLRQVLRTQLKT